MIHTVYLSLGEVTTGLWCQRCLLPSAFSATVWTYSADDGSDLSFAGTFERCTDCGETPP